MTDELINTDGLSNAIVYLADKLGITLQQMYAIYVSAQQNMAIINLILVIVGVIGFLGIIWFGIRYYKKNRDPSSWNDNAVFITMIIMIFGNFGWFILLMVLRNSLIAIFCPEYTALQSLMYDLRNFIP